MTVPAENAPHSASVRRVRMFTTYTATLIAISQVVIDHTRIAPNMLGRPVPWRAYCRSANPISVDCKRNVRGRQTGEVGGGAVKNVRSAGRGAFRKLAAPSAVT